MVEMPIQFRLKELIAEKERIEGIRLTYEEVAKRANVNKNTVSRLANQQQEMVALKTLERLCRFFGCDLADLMVMVDGRRIA